MKLLSLILSTLLTLTTLSSCKEKSDLTSIVLSDNWTFSQAGTNEWMSAKVPGTVHADLLTHKKIENPYTEKNEEVNLWVEKQDWIYKTNFNADAKLLEKNNIEIEFDGLDTYCDVYLNDTKIITGRNMFISYSAPIKEILKTGENELRIHFYSPVNKGLEMARDLGYIMMIGNEKADHDSLKTRVFTRKAPFHYGWDWGPRMVTSGIWRPVRINAWNDAKIEDIYIKPVIVKKEKATYKAILEINSNSDISSAIDLNISETNIQITKQIELKKGLNTITVDFEIKNPKLWWSNGLGEAHLYDLGVSLNKEGALLDSKKESFGVRSIELVQEPDSIGRSFMFKLNGIPVFAKGANYIPSETLTPSVTKEVYQRVIKDAVDANMNMLRVWGGAIYENDYFYDLCDQNGIMVWQDFMFACENIPPIKEILDDIRDEANYNVKRLRNHACMALWCGNNENLRAWNKWHWKDNYSPENSAKVWETYEKIFYNILPNAVKTYHPELKYWASSPSNYPGNKLADRTAGDEHDWSIWFGAQPFENYHYNVPRFCSEYGMQSYPEMKTVKTFTKDQSQFKYRSDIMEFKQRSNMDWVEKGLNGNGMIMKYINRYYNEPKDFESYVYLSQVVHSDCIKNGIEGHRKAMPHCMGSLYWQINDCWPTMSWATVDYYGRWKGSHYAAKRANNEIIVVPHIEDDDILVYVVSDKLELVNAELELLLLNIDGSKAFEQKDNIEISPNSSKIYLKIKKEDLLKDFSEKEFLLHVNIKVNKEIISENNLFFTDIKNIDLPFPNITKTIIKEGNKQFIKLNTNKFAKSVALSTETDGFFSDNYFDMLPGEIKVIEFSSDQDVNLESELDIRTVADSYKH